jgi:hypothetical protein
MRVGATRKLQVRIESQLNPVADEVSATTAAVRPILTGTLNALRHDLVSALGGIERVPLRMLTRL